MREESDQLDVREESGAIDERKSDIVMGSANANAEEVFASIVEFLPRDAGQFSRLSKGSKLDTYQKLAVVLKCLHGVSSVSETNEMFNGSNYNEEYNDHMSKYTPVTGKIDQALAGVECTHDEL